jgi:hypothetical protein
VGKIHPAQTAHGRNKMLTIEDIKKDWMLREEACQALGVSRFTIWRKCQAGILKDKLFAGRVWIKRDGIDRLLRSTFAVK